MKQGDIVDYKGSKGEVVSVLDDSVTVKLADGEEYLLPIDSIKVNGAVPVAPVSFRSIIDAMRPHVKKMDFLNELAKGMQDAGINELHIRSGNIQAFVHRETYEEKLARIQKEALAESEKRAREEFERENLLR